jgi:hypothetical protein
LPFGIIQPDPGKSGIIVVMVRTHRAALLRVTTAAFAAG